MQGLSFFAIVLAWKHLVPARSPGVAKVLDSENNLSKKANDDRKIITPEIKVNNAFIEEEEDKESQISDEGKKTDEENAESIQEFGRKIITYD